MTTHYLKGNIKHTLQAATVSSSQAFTAREHPSDTSSFLSCGTSSPCKFSEVESLFNVIRDQPNLEGPSSYQSTPHTPHPTSQHLPHTSQQTPHCPLKQPVRQAPSQRTYYHQDSPYQPTTKNHQSMAHPSRPKRQGSLKSIQFNPSSTAPLTDSSPHLSLSHHLRRPFEDSAPFDKINKRLREINKLVVVLLCVRECT